jgi:hypothetical protein
MHDQELLRRAQYDQDNDPPNDLYVIPTAYAPSTSLGVVNNFSAFSRPLRTIRYPKNFKPAIEKYGGRSDPSIWLKMYNIVACASGGNEDHMVGYFPFVMGKASLLWLDNLPAECITSWAILSRLFMTNYQTTYNHPGNTHHLARVRMRRNETLREYTNCYFENCNTLSGVKDEDVIAYYKKGITNIKLFEKIHEADAHTIADLMAYVDKLVDTQDAVMHDFNEEDHDDGGNRLHKRSDEAYMADPPRPSTFLEGDFNMVMNDQCQFHRDAKHTMRECEQLKRALGVPSESKKTNISNNDDRNGDQRFDNRNRRPDRRDYRDRRPYCRNDNRDRRDYRRDYRLDDKRGDYVATTAMTDMTIARVIAVTTSAATAEMIDAMIDVARMTTTATTTTARSGPHRHRLKGATLMVRFSQPTERSTSSSVVAKRPKATGSFDQTQERSGMSTLKLRNLCVGQSSKSLSPGKIIGSISLTSRPTHWLSTP